MNYKVKFTTVFKKGYKRMKKRGADMTLLDNVIETLRQGKSLDNKYHDHELLGVYSGFRECHIKPDWLLVWEQNDNELTLLFTGTGTHADLF